MHPSERTDLSWLAFCYIAGEMSAEEADLFEERLAVDQQAREAVVRSVELSQAVASLPPQTVSPAPEPQAWRRPLAWMTAGAAAACLAFLVWFIGSNGAAPEQPAGHLPIAEAPGSNERGGGIMEDPAARRLVALWTHSADDMSVLLESLVSEPQESDDHEFESLTAADDEDAFIVPGWMLAAVSTDLELDAQQPAPPKDN